MRVSGVLFISPFTEDAARLSEMLRPMPLWLTHVRNLEHARATLQENQYDVILTEADLGEGGWLDVLQLARQFSPNCEVVVTDALADGRLWAEALNLGAYDLVAQPFSKAEVQRILRNACSSQPQIPQAMVAGRYLPN
jgi:DNA-binding NtrC family response regulator